MHGMEYGRLLMLFKVHLVVNEERQATQEVDMAFIQMYDDFAETVGGNNSLSKDCTQDQLWKCGFQRLYEIQDKDVPQLEVIPVSRIIGTAPLVPDFLEGKCEIPASVKHLQKWSFPRGKATAGRERGSTVVYVNPHAVKFGRL